MGREHVVQGSHLFAGRYHLSHPAVSITEPQALTLSRRQTRGGECIDSNAEGKTNTAAGEPGSRRKDIQLRDGKRTSFYDLRMQTKISVHGCTHIQKTNYLLGVFPA